MTAYIWVYCSIYRYFPGFFVCTKTPVFAFAMSEVRGSAPLISTKCFQALAMAGAFYFYAFGAKKAFFNFEESLFYFIKAKQIFQKK